MIELRLNPLFREAMKEIKAKRPIVPKYQPCQSQEETSSLWEQIKFASGRQEGFDLVYFLLTGERV